MAAVAALPKSAIFFLRAEQSSGALDLSSHQEGNISCLRKDYVFVVNPIGSIGQTGKEWKKLLPHLGT